MTTVTVEREQRVCVLRHAEVRATSSDGRIIEGYAAVFDMPSEDLGGFREIVQPGAFRRALERSDIRCLVNHHADKVLGRTRSGTLSVWEDTRGLHYRVQLPDTTLGNEVRELVRRGDLSQSSFSFTVAPDGERWHTDSAGRQTRTLVDVAEVYDLGPCTFPAYNATSVSARALERVRRQRKSYAEHWAETQDAARLARHERVRRERQRARRRV